MIPVFRLDIALTWLDSADLPWVQYNGIEGALGRFASILAALVGAAFTYMGTETMVRNCPLACFSFESTNFCRYTLRF